MRGDVGRQTHESDLAKGTSLRRIRGTSSDRSLAWKLDEIFVPARAISSTSPRESIRPAATSRELTVRARRLRS
jgi:hypothetical protein